MKESIINKDKLDVLKELANIGVGNALTSLSQMLNEEKVEMDVPVATLAPLQDVPDLLGGEELPVAGIYIESHGDINLTILFVLSLESAANLVSVLVPGSQGEFNEMGLSALVEVGNILTASYLNALSFMTDLKLLPSPPVIAVDMSAAIISTVMAEAHIVDDEVVLLKTFLKSKQSHISGHILILPDVGALDSIFTLLGAR
ncbi:MAG: chemotaxis protein CheC [Firmicutes bacterium]|nr:chemotaxis protein CheC [Bacillota bacterium]